MNSSGTGYRLKEKIRLLWIYLTTRYQRFRSRAALEVWQERRMAHFVRRQLIASPYYRPYISASGRMSLADVPYGSKALLMANFAAINTLGVELDEAMTVALAAESTRDFRSQLRGVTVGLSTGTSGHRGLFLVSPQEQVLWAGKLLAKCLPDSLLARHKVALFLRANSNLYESIGTSRLAFRYFDILRPLPELIDELRLFSPDLLVAPPSVLQGLATAQTAGDLSLRLRRVISVAEVLEPSEAAAWALVFACPVHQIYQATEGFLGFTCAQGTLHLNEDMMLIEKEWVDRDSGRFHPVITDFTRTTQPMIRYRLDDILVEKIGGCACGSPLLALQAIEGRRDDIFLFAAASANLGDVKATRQVYPDFIRRAVAMGSSAITDYEVEQQAVGAVCVRLAVAANDRLAAETSVMQRFASLATELRCVAPTVTFQPLAAAGEKGKKRRRVRRTYPLVQI